MSIPAPADSRVAWTLDDAEPVEGAAFTTQALTTGRHELKIEVSTEDDRRTAEVIVFVLDPRLAIDAPTSVRAGDPLEARARFEVEPPAELLPLLSPGRWNAAGRPIGNGDSATVTFDRRGSERLSVGRTLSGCGRSIEYTSSTIVEVRPGPALRLLGGQLVRGRQTRIEAMLSQASEISRVSLSIGGRAVDAAIDPPAPNGTALAWAEFTADSTDPIEVIATPILKDDRGVDRAPTDPECARRAQRRLFMVVEPDVGIVVEKPTQGSTAPYGVPFDIVVRPEGRDAASITSIEVKMTPERGADSTITLTKGGNWSASVTPSADMGSRIDLTARALEAKTPITEPIGLRVELSAHLAALTLTGAASSGTLSWSGRNAEPPLVTASIVVEGSDQPYPLEGLSGIEWSVRGGLEIETQTDSDRSIGAKAVLPGTATLLARVRTTDGRSYELRRDVTVRPERVVGLVGPGETSLSGSEAIEPVHDGTTGAWTDVRLRIRRGERDWEPYEPGTIIESTADSAQEIEVEAWYRPWSVADNATPWSDGSGWVRAEPMRLTLTPPRDWTWPVIAAAVGLALAFLWASLFNEHEYRGAEVIWKVRRRDGGAWTRLLGASGEIIGTSGGPAYNFVTRSVRLPLPTWDVEGFDGLRWLKDLGRDGEASVYIKGGDASLYLDSNLQTLGSIGTEEPVLRIAPPGGTPPHPAGIAWDPLHLELHYGDEFESARVLYRTYQVLGVAAIFIAWTLLVLGRFI